MILQSCKIAFKPTKIMWEAIEKLTIELSKTEIYVGKWSKSDTLRYLLMMPYVPHSYPSTKIKRFKLVAVNVTSEQYDQLIKVNPKLEDESGCGYAYRLITSGLIQLGYLTVESEPFDQTEIKSRIVNKKRLPRKIDLLRGIDKLALSHPLDSAVMS